MENVGIAGLALVLVMASSAIGLLLQSRLREPHRRRETTDAIRLIMAIVVTFTALFLGLVTSSVKSSYDLFDARLRQRHHRTRPTTEGIWRTRRCDARDAADVCRRRHRRYLARRTTADRRLPHLRPNTEL